ncbi:unnamed protein product [Orchesella dallaii]|uniref:Uncharacterized protein n=1 Tax=Orchesella dallaii TaxID=48710 RepID=A0ABP1QLA6_9HEXA
MQTKTPKSHIEAGLTFLEKSCRPITGFQNDCIGKSRATLTQSFFPEDVFTSITALDLLGDSLSPQCKAILRKFVTPESVTGTVNFNKYQHVIPDDVEDTGLYHYVFLRDGLLQNDKRILDVTRLIYLNKGQNGIIQLYYTPCEDKRKERLEAGCLSNAMRFLYYIGASEEAEKTEDYLYHWLVSGKYQEGTRYYPSPDTFLFFCSKAISLNEKAKGRFETELVNAVKERVSMNNGGDYKSTTGDNMERKLYPLDVALQILALNNLGKLGASEFAETAGKLVELLKNMQEESGAWPKDALFKLGGSDTYLGGRVVSTIFAVAALQAFDKSYLAYP